MSLFLGTVRGKTLASQFKIKSHTSWATKRCLSHARQLTQPPNTGIKMRPQSREAARSIVTALLGYILVVHRLGTEAASCLPLSISIKAPDSVTPARNFHAKVTITNQGTTWLQNVAVAVNLPVEVTVLKLAPASLASVDNPWSLVLPTLSLAPRKSETIAVQAVTSKCFQGVFDIAAIATLPSDPACGPVETTRTVSSQGERDV